MEVQKQLRFKALVIKRDGERFVNVIEDTDLEFPPTKGVLIKVHHSSINYKDRMSCRGDIKVTRRFPHIPGIDAVGVVVGTESAEYNVGDKVIASGFDLGMNTPGGFAQYVRVPSNWVTKLPAESSLPVVAAIGTAGYTAYLGVMQISQHLKSKHLSRVAVTGATGGVGCLAVYFLNLLGFPVTAITTRLNAEKFLTQAGASDVIDYKSFVDTTQRSLLPESFSGGLDTVGGEVLSTILRLTRARGIVCATGMVKSTNFSVSIMPFILRGVVLAGINADLNCAERESTWESILKLISNKDVMKLTSEVTLDRLPERINQMESGLFMGRTVINLWD